jgi:ParB family chromosome partitioning protein
MAAVQKIALSPSRDIPFNKLVLSQANVRQVSAGVSIEELAEDIARRTLLQGLSVRPVLDAEGSETGMFEVPAGGRRFRALELLVKQKRLAKTAPIPCVVRAGGIAEEDSLAENVQRAPLHPLDQFRAFQSLRVKGQSEEEIAAAFFVGVNVVKQRLRLAAVSEKLLGLYADDAMSLEQLMAFSVAPDHVRQEQVWEAIRNSHGKEPYQIRRLLTETTVRVSDRRALFVGLKAYEAAGGVVMRDLFEQDQGGWVEDLGLLDRMVGEKLKAEAEAIAARGWKWVEAALHFPYGRTAGLRRLTGRHAELTEEEQARHQALTAEFNALSAEYAEAEELPDAIDQRFGELEAAIAVFDERPMLYDPAEILRAGVFVSVTEDGRLLIEGGYVRPEDEAPIPQDPEADASRSASDAAPSPEPARPEVQRAIITIGGEVQGEPDEDDVVRPLPDRLLGELTAHRTLALRDAVACNPYVAMTALLHKLCLDTFQHRGCGLCLEASVRHVYFPVQATDLNDSPSAKAIADRQDAWTAELPKDEAALWDWLDALNEGRRAALLAHCVSFGVNALYQKGDPYGGPGPSVLSVQRRLAQADRLARAVGLDMVDAGWQPTVDNYLGRVTKPRILEAVREAKGDQAAQLIDHLKKGDMAREAERLLDGTGWLPAPLRLAEDEALAGEPSGKIETLPDFLSVGDGESGCEGGDPAIVPIAAE